MRHKKLLLFGVLVVIAAAVFVQQKMKRAQPNGEVIKEIQPATGRIQNIISTTGTVLPKNRLEVKPPVNGRVDQILVQEGEKVKPGQVIAWMSSTERAALLDAARGQGEETLKYWKEVYKAIPLISPIEGEVIVATTQPGQTISTTDAVIVLSDKLIVRAQVDETDIGKVKTGLHAIVVLDAYPDTKIKATVEHIYYESSTVNNVTVYQVDLQPENIPSFFRSGMNATINLIERSSDNALLLPVEAVIKEKDRSYVLLKQGGEAGYLKREIKTGLTDDKNIEVISGVGAQDTVILKTKKYALPQNTTGGNPFMPGRAQRR